MIQIGEEPRLLREMSHAISIVRSIPVDPATSPRRPVHPNRNVPARVQLHRAAHVRELTVARRRERDDSPVRPSIEVDRVGRSHEHRCVVRPDCESAGRRDRDTAGVPLQAGVRVRAVPMDQIIGRAVRPPTTREDVPGSVGGLQRARRIDLALKAMVLRACGGAWVRRRRAAARV